MALRVCYFVCCFNSSTIRYKLIPRSTSSANTFCFKVRSGFTQQATPIFGLKWMTFRSWSCLQFPFTRLFNICCFFLLGDTLRSLGSKLSFNAFTFPPFFLISQIFWCRCNVRWYAHCLASLVSSWHPLMRQIMFPFRVWMVRFLRLRDMPNL